MKSHYYKSFRAILLATAILAAPAAFANSIRFDFGPVGTPSLTALFQDTVPGQVQLTIDALALNGNNSINSICFNFNPTFDAKGLTFTQTGSVGGVSGLVSSANDSYKVGGGGGKFDIDFIFGPDFKTGDSVTYSISGIPNLTVNDFLFLETASAGRTPGYAAGSIQDLSGFFIVQGTPQQTAVPDISSTFGLLVTALLALGFLGRRFKAGAKA
jgi:hypothetical protein